MKPIPPDREPAVANSGPATSGAATSGRATSREGEPPADPGFDERLRRLEGIVVELEAGGLGLETAIERYREGVALLKGCREILGGYRGQVEELAQDAELALRPYSGDPDASLPDVE